MPTDIIVSQATLASALDGTELVPCTQAGNNRALTPAQIAAYISLLTTVLTRLTVDNLRLDGNTLSSINTNGDVVIDPNGTGRIAFGGQTSADPAFVLLSSFLLAPALRAVAADFSQGASLIGATVATPSDTAPSTWISNGNVEMGTNGQLRWRDGSNLLTSTEDTGEVRAAAGVLRDTNGGSGLGNRLTGRPVEASTAGSGSPNLLLAIESRKLLTNEGAGAEAYNTLPSAAAGIEFAFYCQDSDGIRVVAAAGDTIRINGTPSAVAGFVRSVVVGSALILTAINATEWVALSSVGTWTVDV